jgi:hypothetical protein
MFARGLISSLCASLSLAACGTYVPDIQEFPGDSRAGNQLVTAILTNVKCELRDALQDFYDRTHGEKTFLDNWGIQTNLDLTISEKGELSPSADIMPVSPANAVFTLGLGINGSSQATRTDKIMSFNTVTELRALHRCDPRLRGGPWLLQSDLKLNEWLISALLASDTNSANYSTFTSKDSVLSHEVKFEVVSGGDLTPSWKLVRATVNPSGTFLSVNRDRTHDLTITLGPTDATSTGPNKGKRVPSRAAADAALASQIGLAVANSVNRAVRP